MKRPLSILLILISISSCCLAQVGGWTRITDTANHATTIAPQGIYHGASWVDIDNDGDIDLFAAPDKLFRNDGGDRFTELYTPIGANQTQGATGASWADFDNDGDMDCMLARNPSRLYRNNGTGIFMEDTTVFTTPAGHPSWACAWGDVNNDGLLDLFLAHPANFLGAPFPCYYFKQNASHHLDKVTGYRFTDTLAPYTNPYWSDFDLDGDQDLFIASGPGGSEGPDYLYRNMRMETGRDTLVRMRTQLFASENHDGQCYNFIDYDNDGDLDLCHTSWRGAPTKLYRNDAGTYTAVMTPFSLTAGNLGNSWADLDNDGDLDVIISSETTATRYYRNDGNGRFVISRSTLTDHSGANTAIVGDYDNDGDLDVYVYGQSNQGTHCLYRNDTVALGNHWISISCQGTASNWSAIGAIVRVKATIHGVPTWQIREISSQNSAQSQHDLRVHVGLGDAATIDSVIIRYLGGHTDTYANLAADRFYKAVEGQSIAVSVRAAKAPIIKSISLYPNPAHDRLTVLFRERLAAPRLVTVLNASGQAVFSMMAPTARASLDFNIAQLPPGLYSIQVAGGGITETARLSKE